jgi:hypothetical protein
LVIKSLDLDPDQVRDWIQILIGIGSGSASVFSLKCWIRIQIRIRIKNEYGSATLLTGSDRNEKVNVCLYWKKEEAEKHCLKVGPIQTATTVAHAMNIIAGMCPQREGLLSTLLEAVIMAFIQPSLHTRLYFIPEGTVRGLGTLPSNCLLV